MDKEMMIIVAVFLVAIAGFFRVFKTIRVFIGGAVSLYGLYQFFQYIIQLS